MRKRYIWNQDLRKLVEVEIQPIADDVHYVIPDLAGYVSPTSLKYIEGRTQRREDMKKSGVREVDPEEKQSFMDEPHMDLSWIESEGYERELAETYDNIESIEFRRKFNGPGNNEIYEI